MRLASHEMRHDSDRSRTTGPARPKARHDVGNRLWHRLATHTQPRDRGKLEISAPGGDHEHEADRVVDQVSPATIRMRAAHAGSGTPLPDATSARITALRGRGEPLAGSLRAYFETRFGRDLGTVRLHHGPEAAAAAHEVGARAFTVGHDVVFGRNRYRPETEQGRRLLAHELTHVVQQSGPHQRDGAVAGRQALFPYLELRNGRELDNVPPFPNQWLSYPLALRPKSWQTLWELERLDGAVFEAVQTRHDFQNLIDREHADPPMLKSKYPPEPLRSLAVTAPFWFGNPGKATSPRGPFPPPTLADLVGAHSMWYPSAVKALSRHSLYNKALADFIQKGIKRFFPDIGYSPGPPPIWLRRLRPPKTALDIYRRGFGRFDAGLALVELLSKPKPDEYYY